VPRLVLVLAFAALALALASAEWPTLQPYAETLPGSAVRLSMTPVPFRGDAPGFWISRQAVTSAEYAAYLAEQAETGRPAAAHRQPASAGLTSSPDPDGGEVALVSLADALGYTRWLAAKTGHRYRLPSETEWEQACRAGQGQGGGPEWTLAAARGLERPPAHLLKAGAQADAGDGCAAERADQPGALGAFRVMRAYEAGRP